MLCTVEMFAGLHTNVHEPLSAFANIRLTLNESTQLSRQHFLGTRPGKLACTYPPKRAEARQFAGITKQCADCFNVVLRSVRVEERRRRAARNLRQSGRIRGHD